MATWEDILIMIEDGDMPPDDEPQPDAKQREAVTAWIDQAIKDAAKQSKGSDKGHGPIARRLTNVEYENTMRDLLGVDLDLAENLPVDPVKHYEFNNSAELMRLGPEQIDRYLENARHALASVIVEGEQPEVIKHRKEWSTEKPKPNKDGKVGMPPSHVDVHGRHGPSKGGLTMTKFPERGLFKLRFQASAVLTKGATEVPLHWIIGESIQVNSSTRRVKPLGTVIVKSPKPQVFELTGRIENFPKATGRKHHRKKIDLPDAMFITPINLYEDGTVKDDRTFFKDLNKTYSRPSLEWLEFEGPIYEAWPPKSHQRILFDSPLRESDPDAYVKAGAAQVHGPRLSAARPPTTKSTASTRSTTWSPPR